MTLNRHFGSFTAAMHRAGLQPLRSFGAQGPWSEYRAEKKIAAVRRAQETFERRPMRQKDYDRWRVEELRRADAAGRAETIPSLSGIIHAFGSWRAALVKAGIIDEGVAARLARGQNGRFSGEVLVDALCRAADAVGPERLTI